MDKLRQQPWLADPVKECIFIMAPALIPVAAVFIFRDYFLTSEVNTFWWVLLVVCIDVSHVYSTLFRLYWDRQTFHQYKKLLLIIPLIALLVGFSLHYYNSLLFWRVLAYIAVFHFVRQQYGFMRLYSRQESREKWIRLIDSVAIYNATLYPLAYWHLHLTGKLSWFVQGDFISIAGGPAGDILLYIYIAILSIYAVKECVISFRYSQFNIPKNLILAGTYASWYVGIVAFQGDLIFTLLNVVAHGIPYMGLVWIYGEKKAGNTFSFTWKAFIIFAGVLVLLAYLEEYIWDAVIWKDHTEIFPILSEMITINNSVILSIIVSVLILPQLTHYVLDGFIWRFSKEKVVIPK